MPSGEITYAQDLGTIWTLGYRIDGNGDDFIHFDHRCFGDLYNAAVPNGDFDRDYNFGAGRDLVSGCLKGIRIRVEGQNWERTVHLED